MSGLFRTITAEDWRLSLAAARERRKGAPARLAEALRKHEEVRLAGIRGAKALCCGHVATGEEGE